MKLHSSVTDSRAIAKFKTLKQDFKKIHGSRYGYKKVVYYNSQIKIKIKCKEHGYFEQTSGNHLSGKGCGICSNNIKVTKANFMSKIKAKFNNFIVIKEFVGLEEQCTAICKVHGVFSKVARGILHNGCTICMKEKTILKLSVSNEQFIERSVKIHGFLYNYNKVVTNGWDNTVDIYCNTCNKYFKQRMGKHLLGRGCSTCGDIKQGLSGRTSAEEFVKICKSVHGDRYDLSLIKYKLNKEVIEVICKKHGAFHPTAGNFQVGSGCPRCSHSVSKAEIEIQEHFKKLGIILEGSNKIILNGKELDLVSHKHKIAIEYNGVHWHSSKFKTKTYHKEKTEACNNAGYRLIHIFEDKYVTEKKKILSFLENAFDLGETRVVYGRKVIIMELDKNIANVFLEKYHIQGGVMLGIMFGLYYNSELVGVCVFKKGQFNTKNINMYELTRYASSCKILGGLAKVSKHFQRLFNSTIYTFCDISYFNGFSYLKAGFKRVGMIAPDYKYVISKSKVEHKFKWRKKRIAKDYPKTFGDGSKTEGEMMLELGFYKLYDCGKIRYELALEV